MLLSRSDKGISAASALASARARAELLRSGDADEPPVVWVFSPAYVGNPFERLLLGGMPSRNAMILPCRAWDASLFRDLRRALPPDTRTVLHIHWSHDVYSKARTAGQAVKKVDAAIQALDEIAAGGTRVSWTIHNASSHSGKHPEAEARLDQAIADRAGLIHVMSPSTLPLLDGRPRVEAAKVIRVDHPGYHGFYSDWHDRDDSRALIGALPGQRVLLAAGRIKAYKGIELLLESFDALWRGEPHAWRLLVAGEADKGLRKTLVADLRSHPGVWLHEGRVPDDQLASLYRAADISVLPHLKSLNSGVLALSLTFGVPVVVPAESGSAALVNPDFAETFTAGSADSLGHALKRAARLVGPEGLRAAEAAGQTIDRVAVTGRFAEAALSWARTGVVPDSPQPFER